MLWLIAVGCMLLATLALDLAGGVVWDQLITQVPFNRICAWRCGGLSLAVCRCVRSFFCAYVSKVGRSSWFLHGAFFLGTGLNIWAVLAGQGVAGVLWMQVLSNAVVGILLTAWYLRQVSFVLHGRSFLQAIRFSLPLVPSSILEVVGHRADRIFLDRWAPLSDIGLYTLANQVGQAVKFFYDSVKPAWVPFYVRVSGERADSRSFLGSHGDPVCGRLCVAAVAVLCFGGDVVQWVSRDGRYQGALPLIPIMIGVFFLQGLAPVGSTAILVAEKTSWQPAIQLVAYDRSDHGE